MDWLSAMTEREWQQLRRNVSGQAMKSSQRIEVKDTDFYSGRIIENNSNRFGLQTIKYDCELGKAAKYLLEMIISQKLAAPLFIGNSAKIGQVHLNGLCKTSVELSISQAWEDCALRILDPAERIKKLEKVVTMSSTRNTHRKRWQYLGQCRPKVRGRFAFHDARNPATRSVVVTARWATRAEAPENIK